MVTQSLLLSCGNNVSSKPGRAGESHEELKGRAGGHRTVLVSHSAFLEWVQTAQEQQLCKTCRVQDCVGENRQIMVIEIRPKFFRMGTFRGLFFEFLFFPVYRKTKVIC